MSYLKEFRDFALRGNVLDLAIGVIIGGAFGKITTSLVSDILTPPLGAIMQGEMFSTMSWTIIAAQGEKPAVTINYGSFLQTVVDFIIIAFVIFAIIKLKNKIVEAADRKKAEEAAAAAAATPPPGPSAEEQLLTEIRDLLRQQNRG